MKIVINIRNQQGQKMDIDISELQNIGAIKKTIMDNESFFPYEFDELQLVLNSKELHDDQLIRDSGIKNGATLYTYHCPKEEKVHGDKQEWGGA